MLALRRLDGSSTVKAFVKVKVGGITIKGCKVVEQPGQKAWLAMPSTKTAHGGQTVVEVTRPLRDRITGVVLEAWQRHDAPIHPPTRGTATRERAPTPEGGWLDDSDAAARDLAEGSGWQERAR